MGDARAPILRLGDALFDARRAALADKNGSVIPLRPQSVDVLKTLAAHAGTVVSKDTLLAEVWGNVAVTDDSLTQCIADIRRALGDRDHRIVQTVPKKGYRLVADAPRGQLLRKRWAIPAGLAAALIVALLGAWHAGRTAVKDGEQGRTLIASPAIRAGPSIAVLPFESIENEERWTRLGRGLAADIASELALNDWLYVTVPESLINVAFGSSPEGHLLDVRFALSGTIQAQDDAIRIATHLTDVSTREVLWSETWTESQNDIFTVQDRIISRIGASLASSYTGAVVQADLERAKRRLTGSLDAYEHYLIAFEMLHRFEPATYPEVIRHLETALELDPEFAGALVTLSVAQRNQAAVAEGADAQHWLEASQASAYRAYAIDPNNPNVLWNVARAYAHDGQLTIAGKTLRRAVALAPNNADVLMIAAGYSRAVGIAGPEPLSWARRALELNPLAPAWWYAELGEAAFGAGDFDLAVESMRRALPSDRARWLITALAEAHRGNLEKARRAAQRVRDLAPNLTVEAFAGGTEADRPDQHLLFEGARLLGLPITDADLKLANTPSIAVLPFEAIDDTAKWVRLGRGLAADLAGALSRNHWLHVTAPESAEAVASTDTQVAGRALGARLVLAGHLQIDGARLRVASRLSDSLTGEILWSDTWIGAAEDMFKAQDQIIARIDASLSSTWTGAIAQTYQLRAHQHPTDSLTAFEHFLLGTEAKHLFTAEGYAEAVVHLERAVAIDPDFATAWATLSLVYVLWSEIAVDETQRRDLLGKSTTTALRAMEADPEDPQALLRYAQVLSMRGDHSGTITAVRKAVDAMPNNADVLISAAIYGLDNASIGAEATRWAERAMRLNPRHPDWYWTALARARFDLEDFAGTLQAASRGEPQMIDTHVSVAAAAGMMDDRATAVAAMTRLVALAGPDFSLQAWASAFSAPSQFEKLAMGFRKAGLPVTPQEVQLANAATSPPKGPASVSE